MSKSFRICAKRFHITYKTHIDQEGVRIHLQQLGGLEHYSIVHESSDTENPYEHTHVLIWYKAKFQSTKATIFDYEGIHPNIQVVKTNEHWDNTWKYHEKAPLEHSRSEYRKDQGGALDKRIQQALSLWDACELAGVEIRTVQDVMAIRRDRARTLEVSSYEASSWRREFEENYRVLFIHGGTNTGKTEWAIAHFSSCLLVRHMDKLKEFNPQIHDGIVFDDMSFKHIPREAMIHLLDWNRASSIHCRHSIAEIPARTRKIFTSNLSYDEVFPEDSTGAIYRRITKRIEVIGPLYFTEGEQVFNLPLNII